jgi:hypothetical protein
MVPMLVIAGIFAVVAALDRERPRLRWAKQSLIIFSVVAISTGVLMYLLDSGQLGRFMRGSVWEHQRLVSSMRGLSFGMFIVLVSSGQFWVKKGPPKSGQEA